MGLRDELSHDRLCGGGLEITLTDRNVCDIIISRRRIGVGSVVYIRNAVVRRSGLVISSNTVMVQLPRQAREFKELIGKYNLQHA